MTLLSRINRALRTVHHPKRRAALREGIKTELEHSATVQWIKRHPKATVVDAAKRIASDHISERPDYYDALAVVEGKVKRKKGLKAPRIKLLMKLGWVRVYLVDATAVRKMKSISSNAADFTMGTNWAVWNLPKGELWISDEIGPPRDPLEMRLTTLHESAETRRMVYRGMSYDNAHDMSLALEEKYRKAKGRGLKAALKNEARLWNKRSGE